MIPMIKEIENGQYELVIPSNEDPSPGYLLTLMRERFILIDEVEDIEIDGKGRCDIFYFMKCDNK